VPLQPEPARRFSADKSPYKTNLGAWRNLGDKKKPTAGYYLNVEPGNSFLAGGTYRPEPGKLALIRQEVAQRSSHLVRAALPPR